MKLTKPFLYFLLLFIPILLIRFIFLPEIASWDHDNSRELVNVYKMFEYGEIIYRGPVFSEIWGFLSPLYYYVLAPFFLLTSFHPLSPALFSTLINLVALLLLGVVCYKIFDLKTALFAFILYGFSFKVALEGAYGLNPNFLPPLSILLFYFLVKIIKEGKPLFFYLLTFTLALMVNFHPGGFFALLVVPIILFFYKKLPNLKTFSISSLIFFIFAVIPYGVVEKKFNFWNTKQVIKYIRGDLSSEVGASFIDSMYYFSVVFMKNISLLLFNKESLFFILLSVFLVLFLVFSFLRRTQNKNIQVLFYFLLSYTLIFLLFIRFERTDQVRAWWFHTVFIPLFVMLLAFYIRKLNIKISVFILSIFILINLFSFITYEPLYDRYIKSRIITETIRKDSEGKKIEILGIDSRPIKYMLWYFEDGMELKEKYYTWVKWEDENKDAEYVYYIPYNNDTTKESRMSEIKGAYGLNSHVKIYDVSLREVYRLYNKER